MATDLAIDNNGDVVFAGNRDLMLVTNEEQIEQRIRMRLLLPQGTYTYDSDEFLGSDISGPDLSTILRRTSIDNRVIDDLSLRVQEALAPIEEIQVSDVQIETSENGRVLEVTVVYRMTPELVEEMEAIGQTVLQPDEVALSLTIPASEEDQ